MSLCFESARLRYRPLEIGDLDLAIEQWTDPEVVRYVADRTYSEQELVDEMPIVVRRCAAGCIGIWVLIEKRTGEKLGSVFLLPMPVELDDTDWDLVVGEEIPEANIEVGYILKRVAWGKGYATEACTRMMQFAFEVSPLQEVVATIDPDNQASRRVLTKSGLREIGLIRAYQAEIPGFKITRAQWQADRQSAEAGK